MVGAEFRAPWSRTLRGLSTFVSLLMLALICLRLAINAPRFIRFGVLVGLPLIVLAGSLPFMIRGYVITPAAIEVRRLGWSTRLPLAGLLEVVGDPGALAGSIRLFGNGGLYSFTGLFWNRKLGRYRAFMTDPQRAVLLKYRDRTIVVTPGDVQHFIVAVRKRIGNAGATH